MNESFRFAEQDEGSNPSISTNGKLANIGRISTVEREPGSQRIATLTESYHDPGSYVGDPALLCTASGDGEPTIIQFLTILTRMVVMVFHLCPFGGIGRRARLRI